MFTDVGEASNLVNRKRKRSSTDLSTYRDQHFKGNRLEQERLLRESPTLYIGNMSFYTTEEQVYELFNRTGELKRIVMGLDKFKKTPCGFCFVEYYTREDAEAAMRYINGTRLDDRIIRTDWDTGFVEGRQYGRGKSGGQVRDEYRQDYDSGREVTVSFNLRRLEETHPHHEELSDLEQFHIFYGAGV